MKFRPSFFTLVLALIPCLACSPNEQVGDEEVGDSAGTEGTGTEDTGGESGDGQGESGLGETAEETEGTTGDPGLNEQLCMDSCAAFAECLGGDGLPNCYEDCLDRHDALDGECLGNYQALDSCILGLSCPEIMQFLDEEPEPYPCQAEAEALCDAAPCTVDVAEGQHPNECYLEYSCPDEPIYSVACDVNGCSCMVDGDQVAMCEQSMEVCSDFSDFSLIDECCGWEL